MRIVSAALAMFACLSAASAQQIVEHIETKAIVAPGEAVDASAVCPSGSIVVGGGFAQNQAGGSYVTTHDYPISANSWYVRQVNASLFPASSELTARAICSVSGTHRYHRARRG